MTDFVKIAPDVQTLIWDFDGTLLDSFSIYSGCLNEVLHRLGRPGISEEFFRNNYHGSLEDSITNVLREAGHKLTATELAEVIRNFYILDNNYIKNVENHLFEDALDLAERAHKAGKRQVVVTNRPHGTNRGNGSPRVLIAGSPRLSKLVSDILCGDDSHYRKPHRASLETRFGSGAAELGKPVVIGDQFIDAEFANNLGCPAVLVARDTHVSHLDRLANWQDYTRIVRSLRDVHIA